MYIGTSGIHNGDKMESFKTNEIAELTFAQLRERCILEDRKTKKFLKTLEMFSSSY